VGLWRRYPIINKQAPLWSTWRAKGGTAILWWWDILWEGAGNDYWLSNLSSKCPSFECFLRPTHHLRWLERIHSQRRPWSRYCANKIGRSFPKISKNLKCRLAQINLVGCHMPQQLVRELLYTCGSSRRPVSCHCSNKLGYEKEPMPIEGMLGKSFAETCPLLWDKKEHRSS